MRNTVLVLLGKNLEVAAQQLKQYVLQYGETDVTDFLQVAVWRPAGDGDVSSGICASLCQLVEKSHTDFCSDLSDEYNVALDKGTVLNTDEEIREWWSSLFRRTVTLQHQGDAACLHLCLVAQLWDKDMVEQSLRIARIVKALSHNFVVDVLGVPPTLASIFDDSITVSAQKSDTRKTTARDNVQILTMAKHNEKLLHAVVLFEGANTEGVALNMEYDTWMRLVGEYALIATENYLSLFPHNADLQETDCTTFGLSILNFDKFYFIHYLLRRAYLKILGREQVQQTEVDINKVAAIAQEQLKRHYHRFTTLYEEEVKAMLAQGMNEQDILPIITGKVKQETQDMVGDFQSFIDSEQLSLPEKQATLAQLLGLNDELYIGNLFARDQLVFEDCGSDVIDAFVREDNLLGKNSVLSTPRDPETGKVFSPIKPLKDSRLRIMESDRYIRGKVQEQEQWKQQITETIESEKRLTPEGFVYGNVTYRFMADQEVRLFEKTYEPKEVKVGSVDMRSMFTPIRNQGSLGACTVFAVTGVYEFLLKKLGKAKTDLSEHFVYYNVSVDGNGNTRDEGSSLFSVAQSMSDKGICLEELCRYNGSLERPSKEAYDEAKNHLVKEVKNVAIGSDMDANHKAITSALAEGFPVVISLKLYDSFGEGIKGFVKRPSAEERRLDKHGNHAMVVCGFSNEEKVYIVRNSWGPGFGDQGYCYIPYSYIDDSNFCNQACIITKIAESDELGGFGTTTIKKVSFSTTDASIRYAIAQNQIEEEKLRLHHEQFVYQDLATAYYRLTSDLGNNSVRRQILDAAEQRLSANIAAAKVEKNKFVTDDYVRELQAVKAEGKAGTLTIATIFLLWLLVAVIFVSYEDLRGWVSRDFWITMGVIGAVIGVVFFWYRYYRQSLYNEKERQLNARRDQLANQVRRLEQDLSSIHLKLHIAGMFVDSVNKVQRVLDHKYKLLKSYVSNLAQWMGDEQQNIEHMSLIEKVPFIPIIKNKVLDQFFVDREDVITDSVHLYSFLNEVGLSDEDIVSYKYSVRNKIAEVLERQYHDFSLMEYVLGKVDYPFLPQKLSDIASLMNRLNVQSDCFLQLATTGHLDEGLMSRYVLVNARTDADREMWQAEYPKHFQQKPSDVTTFVSPYKLIELQVRHLKVGQVEFLM